MSEEVRILKEFKYKNVFGEIEYIPYQIAVGFSIRNLECEGMGQIFRLYLGPFKLWINKREEVDEEEERKLCENEKIVRATKESHKQLEEGKFETFETDEDLEEYYDALRTSAKMRGPMDDV